MANRYIVQIESTTGRTTVYCGPNYSEAERICNFWDERVNTYFRDLQLERALETPLDRALRRFYEAIARLESQKELLPRT